METDGSVEIIEIGIGIVIEIERSGTRERRTCDKTMAVSKEEEFDFDSEENG